MNTGEMLIRGAIDVHMHTASDIVARKHTDVQLVRQFKAAGMAGFISKCHYGDTSARAAVASEMGICKLIATHVLRPLPQANLNLHKEYLACGAMLEHCFYTPYY